MLTEHTQPAILAMSVAVLRLVQSRGLKASFAAGHSLGEYSAHVAAGTLSFADALRTVRRSGRYMQEAVPVGEGAMAAILGLERDGVTQACDAVAAETGRVVSPANLNAPGQVVIAGHADAVAAAGERAKTLGAKRVIPLAVSAPFHCALMKPAEERLAPELRALAASDPGIPVVANVDAQPKRTAAAAIDALVRAGLVAGAVGRRRAAARGGRGHHLRRARARHGAGRADQEDRPHRQGREHRRRRRSRPRSTSSRDSNAEV